MSVINTNQLKSALERLCLVVPKRATLPVLENLRWRAVKGHLELTATDLDNRLHISIPFVGEAVDSDVDVLIPAKELCQLVKTESTALSENGASPKTVQAILRHTDIQTTFRYYVHSDVDAQRNALAAIGTIVPVGTEI